MLAAHQVMQEKPGWATSWLQTVSCVAPSPLTRPWPAAGHCSGASMRRAESKLLLHPVAQGEATIQEAAAGALHEEAPQKPPEVRDSPASMYELGGQSQTQQRQGAPGRQAPTRWAHVCPASAAQSADQV